MSVFEYISVVTIGDTNLIGNMYFANHFKIQGKTRELWMNRCVKNADSHLADGLILITKSAHCDYIKGYYLNDEIVCRMTVENIRKASFKLKFEFYHGESNEIHALGWQDIVFANSSHEICRIPDDFLSAAHKYQCKGKNG